MPPSGTLATCSSVPGLTMPSVCSPLLTTSKSPWVGGWREDLIAENENINPNESNSKMICTRNIFVSVPCDRVKRFFKNRFSVRDAYQNPVRRQCIITAGPMGRDFFLSAALLQL